MTRSEAVSALGVMELPLRSEERRAEVRAAWAAEWAAAFQGVIRRGSKETQDVTSRSWQIPGRGEKAAAMRYMEVGAGWPLSCSPAGRPAQR